MVIALVIGWLLLAQVPKSGHTAASTVTTTAGHHATPPVSKKKASKSTTSSSTTSTTVAAPAPSSLKVVVLNGCGLTGVAGDYTNELSSDGYHMLAANNATSNVTSSQIYVVTAADAAGAAPLAKTLGLASSAIVPAPVPSTAPIPSVYLQTSMVDLVVVIGPDLGKKAPTATTTTTAAG